MDQAYKAVNQTLQSAIADGAVASLIVRSESGESLTIEN